MTDQEHVFLQFLKAGLWNQVPQVERPLDNDEWNALLQMAMKQAVMGLVFDGVSLLPAEVKPPRKGMMWWLKYEMKLANVNRDLARHAEETAALFREHGIRAIMVKGLAVAEYYPFPLHRNSGDIDLWVAEEQYHEACEVVKTLNPDNFAIGKEHANAEIGKWVLELHSSLTHSHLLPVSQRAHRWLTENVQKTDGQIYGFDCPNQHFHTIFVFFHFFQHFIQSGVGFRHLCDWCRCLHVTAGQWDEEWLHKTLKSIGLLKPWLVFGYVAVKYMDLPRESMPLYRDYSDRHAQRLIEAMFDEGNFGYHSEHRQLNASGSYVAFRFNNFRWKLQRFSFLFRIFPVNTLRSFGDPFEILRQILTHKDKPSASQTTD